MTIVEFDRDHRIERQAGVVHPDPLSHDLVAIRLAHQRIHERLRDGLNRELDVDVARRMHTAVDLGDRHRKPVRIGLRQYRNVIGDYPASVGLAAPIGGFDKRLHLRPLRSPPV